MSSELTTKVQLRELEQDTRVLTKQVERFLQVASPAYLLDSSKQINEYVVQNSGEVLNAMTYYRIASCTVEKMDDIRLFLDQKMEKFLTAVHSLNVTVTYGIVSHGGTMNLVLGVQSSGDSQMIYSIIKGLLAGIELNEMPLSFTESSTTKKHYGMIVGTPSPIIKDKPQNFDLSGIMRSLYGQDFTLMFIAKPVAREQTTMKYQQLIDVRDQCFAISKRNITRQSSASITNTETTNNSKTVGSSSSANAAGALGVAGAGIGFKLGGGIGAGLGAMLGSTIGSSYTKSKNESVTEGISNAISNAVTEGESVGYETQNGFALELMNYAEAAIERLKHAQSSGLWETAITFSASSAMSRNILQGALYGELAKPNENLLPMQAITLDFEQVNMSENELLIPSTVLQKDTTESSPLASLINTKELGLLFSLPNEQVPSFELKEDIYYPTVTTNQTTGGINLGLISDGTRVIDNMSFNFSEEDINKHVFVCGITGSGKTTTVKRLVEQANKPYLVIESAKKEYRHMINANGKKPKVYTLGKPEINCLRMNPFYIMKGVSPQVHIDYLKDLFNASFSFYGPMPYILEKCLHNIYQQKGWNLTLGFHPYVMNTKRADKFFEQDYVDQHYQMTTHKFLFPTMHDLKNEIERYIEQEMQYEGEVAGNIKTAIKARLESLCSGAKGYMFNTHEFIDMEALLNDNIVLELEGLADDADKAFCVGMLVIYINEYRQVAKELAGAKKLGLQHVLVIEEAHRLLKNIETERSSEGMGNPKGKAVEHFTNMIAEMRSYGQGVVIAEQIPSKLAPDVIKNSSNKIIHRIVSADDQHVIANTIGIKEENAIYLGHLKTGQALCHKEGMHLPMQVQVGQTEDIYRSDSVLYLKNIEQRFEMINLSSIKDILGNEIALVSLKLLNSIGTNEYSEASSAVKAARDLLQAALKVHDFKPIATRNINNLLAQHIHEQIISLLMSGIYSIGSVVSDKLSNHLLTFLMYLEEQEFKALQLELTNSYGENVKGYFIKIVTEQLNAILTSSYDIEKSIHNLFLIVDEKTVRMIRLGLKGAIQDA